MIRVNEVDQLSGIGGPMSGRNIIGETTEAIHKFLLDGYNLSDTPPRIEEDLKFVPKDREEVVYIYMYRLAQNANLMNQRRLRQAPLYIKQPGQAEAEVYMHRPPILLDVFYLLSVHSKFRSDAERLLGWLMVRLNEATHLIYRPRRYILPDGREVDSLGRVYDARNFEEVLPPDLEEDEEASLQIEKVSLSLVDDLTVGDAINLFTLHESPYRPFVTYRARMAMDGPLYKSSGGTTIRMGRLERAEQPAAPGGGAVHSPNGRVRAPVAGAGTGPGEKSPGMNSPTAKQLKSLPGPKPYRLQRMESDKPDPDSDDNSHNS